jgi:FkbM family methyltransferase
MREDLGLVWHPVALWNGVMTMRQKMKLYGHLDEVFIKQSYKWLYDRIVKDTILIDIGAMIGDTSVYFAMNPNVKKVVAIEPNPASYALLRRTVSECPIKKIEAMQVAVSCSKGFSRMSHPYATGFNRAELSESGIRTVTLQSLLSGFRGKRIAIKCDVEGMELSIFRAEPDLSDVYAMQIEVHNTRGEMESILKRSGFRTKSSGGGIGYLYASREARRGI